MINQSQQAQPTASVLTLRNQFNRETFIFTLLKSRRDAANFECILEAGGSGGGDALKHVHPRASETFRVRTGRLRVEVGTVEHVLQAGQVLTIDAGVSHRFKNDANIVTHFDVEFAPRQQHLEFFMAFARLTESKPEWFSASGKPHFLLIALMLHHFADHLYLSSLPVVFQKLLFALLAPVSRFLGYRVIQIDS